MEQQTQDLRKNKRPLIITIICILGFLSIPLSIFGILITVLVPEAHDALVQKGLGYIDSPLFLIQVTLSTLILALALIGYWMMRKWGVYVYIFNLIFGFFFSYIILGAPFKLGDILGYIIPIAIVITGFYYFKEMS